MEPAVPWSAVNILRQWDRHRPSLEMVVNQCLPKIVSMLGEVLDPSVIHDWRAFLPTPTGHERPRPWPG